MAKRTRYLLAYDIRHARRLRRVHRVALDHGEPLQYSVFVCDLAKSELLTLKDRLLTEIKATEDSISIFDLGTPLGRGVQCIEFLGTRRRLPDAGPAVW